MATRRAASLPHALFHNAGTITLSYTHISFPFRIMHKTLCYIFACSAPLRETLYYALRDPFCFLQRRTQSFDFFELNITSSSKFCHDEPCLVSTLRAITLCIKPLYYPLPENIFSKIILNPLPSSPTITKLLL